MLGAVDLDQEKRQRSELSQDLQRQLEEHSSKADHLTEGKGPVWLERLFAYPEGMEAVWKESTERSSEKTFESLSSPETMSPLLDTFLTCGHHILKTPLKCGLQHSSHTHLALTKSSLQPNRTSLAAAGARQLGLKLGTQRALRAGDQDRTAA